MNLLNRLNILLVSFCFVFACFTTQVYSQSTHLVFSHDHGFYTDSFDLTIDVEEGSANIKYTLNGEDPSVSINAKIAESPAIININPHSIAGRDLAPGVIVRACALRNDSLISTVVTKTFLFINDVITLSHDGMTPGSGWLKPGSSSQLISYGLDPDIYNNPEYSDLIDEAFLSIPTMSLVTDLKNLFDSEKGIYVNATKHGYEWERPGSLELINPDKSEGFQIPCGIRIRGGWSRNSTNPKHAFRFFFRSEYGESKLVYPLFGDEGSKEFDKIDLRTAMNYSWSFTESKDNTFLREVFSRDTQRDMNQPYTRSRYYHLFINGTYWGLFQTQERSEASFAEQYFGGSKEDYDVIKVDVGEFFNLYHVEATDGTLNKWRELWDYAQEGFSDNKTYFKVQGLNTDGTSNENYDKLLDVDNLIDYMIITFFTGDFDGPISNFRNNQSPNNFYAIYNRTEPDGFKFFRHDGEHTMFFNDWGIDRTGPFPAGEKFEDSNPQWIHQKLTENPFYRKRFADRVYKHFFNNGALTLENNVKRIKLRKAEIEYAIIAESARWGDSKSAIPRTKADWENAVNFILNDFLPSRNDVVINQLEKKGLFSQSFPPVFNLHGGIVDKGFMVTLSSSGEDIYYTIDGTDPMTPFVSGAENFDKYLIDEDATKKVFVPVNPVSSNWFTDISFDDSKWQTCAGLPGGVGYENGSGYENLITLSVQYEMSTGPNPNNSCLIRIPFEITDEEINNSERLLLNIMYDDGFAAYLNGVQVITENAPDDLAWNSSANTYLEASGFTQYDISMFIPLLQEGKNLLAIHGLNSSSTSSDFLMLPKLRIISKVSNGDISPTAQKYDSPISIDETIKIRTRSFDGTNWSILNEAKFIIDENLSNLKITELHYHPLDQDTISGKEFEFIELKNVGNEDINLAFSVFNEGISYIFPGNTIIPKNEFLVLASNKKMFFNRYGFEAFDEFDGQLNNGGEKISLVNAAGNSVINFKFNDKSPWPEEADGLGYSLVAKSEIGNGDPGNPQYWVRSAEINGSPGEDDLFSEISITRFEKPINYYLHQNYPNPFNAQTQIQFSITKNEKVKIILFDILGRVVEQLADDFFVAGNYNINFDANNLSSGIYFYQLTTQDYSITKKMILLK